MNGTLKNLGLGKFWQHLENIESVFDKSLSLVFAWFVLLFLSLETFYQRISGSDYFLTRILASCESQILPFTTPTCHPVTVEWFPIQTLVNLIHRVLSISLGRNYIRTRSLHIWWFDHYVCCSYTTQIIPGNYTQTVSLHGYLLSSDN